MSTAQPEMEALKTRLKGMWMAGDFGEIARHIETAAEDFVARLNLKPGDQVLDVACGTGNLAVPAARAGAIVTGADIATNLLEQARARAEAEGLKIRFEEGDAENLPYADSAFDVVVTMYGAMFAPRPELEMWLVSPLRLPNLCRVSPSGPASAWRFLPAASGDVLLLALGSLRSLVRDASARAELGRAAEGGGPGLLDHLEAVLSARPEAASALVVELR